MTSHLGDRPLLRAPQLFVRGAAATALMTPALAAATSRSRRWSRTNYRGRRVSLAAGPAVAAGAVLPALAAPAGGAALTGTCAAALGLYDDQYGDSHARGLRGHFAAARRGRVTTGAVKMAGLVVTAAAASVVERRPVRAVAGDVVLVAGTANLLNLLDLRPGRALKVAAATGLGLTAAAPSVAPVAAGVAGAAVAALPGDLRERVMIGDCGANGLGAMLGWCLSRGLSGAARAGAVGVVVGLTLLSERVSFTEFIEGTPVLAALDAVGRAR